jgi:hypothetical protein
VKPPINHKVTLTFNVYCVEKLYFVMAT